MTLPKAVAYGRPTTTVGVTADDATSITVTALTGYFPTLGAGEYVYAVLSSDANMSDPAATYETVKVTAIDDSDPFVLTVDRDEESTAGAQEWAAGTSIACFGTAVAHDDIVAEIGGKADEIHNLVDTTNHPVSGLTIGHILKATGAAAYAFGASTDLPLAGGTMSGNITMADNLIIQPDIKDYCETLKTLTWDSDTQTINLQDGNVFDAAISVAVTSLTISNPRAGAHSFTLRVVQGGTLRAITWPVSVAWAGGSAPTMAINKAYWITFVTLNGGTNWTGFLAGEV